MPVYRTRLRFTSRLRIPFASGCTFCPLPVCTYRLRLCLFVIPVAARYTRLHTRCGSLTRCRLQLLLRLRLRLHGVYRTPLGSFYYVTHTYPLLLLHLLVVPRFVTRLRLQVVTPGYTHTPAVAVLVGSVRILFSFAFAHGLLLQLQLPTPLHIPVPSYSHIPQLVTVTVTQLPQLRFLVPRSFVTHLLHLYGLRLPRHTRSLRLLPVRSFVCTFAHVRFTPLSLAVHTRLHLRLRYIFVPLHFTHTVGCWLHRWILVLPVYTVVLHTYIYHSVLAVGCGLGSPHLIYYSCYSPAPHTVYATFTLLHTVAFGFIGYGYRLRLLHIAVYVTVRSHAVYGYVTAQLLPGYSYGSGYTHTLRLVPHCHTTFGLLPGYHVTVTHTVVTHIHTHYHTHATHCLHLHALLIYWFADLHTHTRLRVTHIHTRLVCTHAFTFYTRLLPHVYTIFTRYTHTGLRTHTFTRCRLRLPHTRITHTRFAHTFAVCYVTFTHTHARLHVCGCAHRACLSVQFSLSRT